MDLADILTKAQIVPDLRAANRWEAIDELIGNLVTTGKIQPGDREAVTAAVKKRETSMSTGIGFGIGIPHASTDLFYEVVGALGREILTANLAMIGDLQEAAEQMAAPAVRALHRKAASERLEEGNRLGHGRRP